MPRESRHRNSHRSRHRESSEQSTLEMERKVLDLEKQLLKKDISLAKDAQRLKIQYGLDVSLDSSDTTLSPEHQRFMSPIRIGVEDMRSEYNISSPVRVVSPKPYQNAMPLNLNFEDFPHQHFSSASGPPQGINGRSNQIAYAHTPEFNSFEKLPRYEDVRVEEIPRWPMETSPPPEKKRSRRPQTFSEVWKNQQDVQVEPLPVFPMGEERKPRKSQKVCPILIRHEKAQLQMEMIAEQARLADKQAQAEIDQKRRERNEKKRKEAEEEKTLLEIRRKVVAEMKKADEDKRRKEREKRHEQQKKAEEERRRKRRHEEERAPTSSNSSKTSSNSSSKYSRFESDEDFLKYLKTALGSIDCRPVRGKDSKNIEYEAICHVVNIPKELIFGKCTSRNKGDAYKGAVSNYVDKLVTLGLFEEKFRKHITKCSKSRRFLATMLEPLCNDIAIFGTQISVTNSADMKEKFTTFAKEKCAEFWANPENCEMLSNFLMNKLIPTHHSSSFDGPSSAKKTASTKSHRRSVPEEKKSPLSANETSLEMLFASHSNTNTSLPLIANQSLPQHPTGHFVGKRASPPSLLSLTILPPPQQLMNQFAHQPMMHQPVTFHPQMVPTYSSPVIQPLMQSTVPQTNHPTQHQNLGISEPTSQNPDIDLMDEIFL